ncbi:MAG: GNAT family N-acetyltransferase [Gammaproteobacteria bacterium]|nr:GNAT family N-acetyltransferase [Gammaproteobacteria bacterium]
MKIEIDNLESIEVQQLLQEHHQDMLKYSPPESVHALDLSALKSPDVTFWTAWINGELAGCGALKKLDQTHAELKSMRTCHKFIRQGVAAKLLTHMLATAKSQCYEKISLETGTMDAFIPAQKLYRSFGFQVSQPFSHYQVDPYSMFLTKDIR